MSTPGQRFLNPLETVVLEHIGRDSAELVQLIPNLHVLSRRYTGVGSYTELQQSDGHPLLADRQLGLNAVITMPRVPGGLTAILFCKHNSPRCLEIVTYEGFWDGSVEEFSIEDITC